MLFICLCIIHFNQIDNSGVNIPVPVSLQYATVTDAVEESEDHVDPTMMVENAAMVHMDKNN